MERDDQWDENDGEKLEAEIMRADHAFGANLHGTSPEEKLEASVSTRRSPGNVRMVEEESTRWSRSRTTASLMRRASWWRLRRSKATTSPPRRGGAVDPGPGAGRNRPCRSSLGR